jgi:hypothetical protein
MIIPVNFREKLNPHVTERRRGEGASEDKFDWLVEY